MKTARMTILLTPDQKAAIHARAERLGISTGEMVRRAVDSYGQVAANDAKSESEVVLDALADELLAAAEEAKAALAAANRDVMETVKLLTKNREVANGGV